MKKWVDPPSGWRYGFPAVWDDEKETFQELLARYKYPAEEATMVRVWPAEEEEN